ncbi:MAG: bifunctional nuclease family protein [Propionicimonas sp.]
MIEVRLSSLAIDARGLPVVLLEPVEPVGDAHRVLPIWIGAPEATAIMLAAEGETPPRPLVYDLMTTLLDRLGAHVSQVAITKLDAGTFHAEITLLTSQGEAVIDARPSDSIALATRTGAPIFVAEAVLAAAGVVDGSEGEDPEVAAFQDFLDSVEPDDFRG